MKLTVVILVVSALLGGCGSSDDDPIGQDCRYVEVPGVAVIVAVDDAPETAYNCTNDPVEVLFDFTPDDPDAPQFYQYPEVPDTDRQLTVGAGMNPAREWVEAKGLTVGSEHACRRQELVEGACTPVLFELVDQGYGDWADSCWVR